MVRILHLADLHLDTPFKGVEATAPHLAKQLQNATLSALDRAVEFALDERGRGRLDAVTFGGDIFDNASPSLRARGRFSEALKRLCESGLVCFVIAGNHDPGDNVALWERQITLPEGAIHFGVDWGVEFIRRDGEPVCAVVGRSFSATRDNQNPLADFEPVRRQAQSAGIVVGLLHCDVGGARTEENGYAPVSLSDLQQIGCHAWLLGHIHKGDVLNNQPFIAYPGNPQGRDINEEGVKGALLIELEKGHPAVWQHIPLGGICWRRVDMSVNHCANDVEVKDAVRDALQRAASGGGDFALDGLIARVTLTGRTATLDLWRTLSDPGKLKEVKDAAAAPKDRPFLLIEELSSNVERPLPARGELLKREDFIGDFLRLLDEAQCPDSEAGRVVRGALGAFEQAGDAREFGGLAAVGLEQDWSEILRRAEEIGLTHLWSEEESDSAQGEDRA